MDDYKRLKTELRAAKEERVRRERDGGMAPPMVPEIDDAFRRLQTLSDEELENHITRLERDLRTLETDDLTAWEDDDSSPTDSDSPEEPAATTTDSELAPLFGTEDEDDVDDIDAEGAPPIPDEIQTRLDADWTGDDDQPPSE